MVLGLGIDTGGTFTDAAVVDLDTKKVIAKAKAPTTYHDLSIGIASAIEQVVRMGGFDVKEIYLVGLSTTLATNSLLTGKGGEVGLIGMGWKPADDWVLGCKIARFVKGEFDSLGRMVEPQDEEELSAAIREVAKDVDAIVISGMFSVTNPWHEEHAAELVRQLTNLPVVTGHSLTGELGIKERTITAVLNARLLPVIEEFLTAVKSALTAMNIKARILVFKGDGGLMSLEVAMKTPVETILSGPAASLMGGKALAQLDDCIVVDVGGASTDIAFLEGGFPRLDLDGAIVGEWRTRVKAIDMWTCGLGGDSLVSLTEDGDLLIGPQRVVPLAVASTMKDDFNQRLLAAQDTTFYVIGKSDLTNLNSSERKVHDFIAANGPSTLYETMDGTPDVVLVNESIRSLMKRGNLLRTGLTPTDIMHLTGEYIRGDAEASRIGLQILAQKMDSDPDKLAERIMTRVVTRIGEEIVKKAMADAIGPMPSSKQTDAMLHAAMGETVFHRLSLRATLDRPIVGIGAPASILVRPLEKRMEARIIIPENYDVGNAVGAVCSEMTESTSIEISPVGDKFMLFWQFSAPMQFSHLEEAVSSARTQVERYVTERLTIARATDIKVRVQREDVRFSDGYGKEMKFVNAVFVRATGTGKPSLDDIPTR
jgi:N-methylhydantoinase A/oxoprolinase/acetone carboxylase beta subunit